MEMLQLRNNFKIFCLEKLVPGMGSILECVSLPVHSPGNYPLLLPTLLLYSCLLQIWLLLGLVASFSVWFCHSSGVLPASTLLTCFPEDGESVGCCLSPGPDEAADVLIPRLGPAIWGLFCFLFFLEVLC